MANLVELAADNMKQGLSPIQFLRLVSFGAG